ncbi:conserved hypothetical protein [methanotrophic bacterial endosymbiont of Bathymodiolus sp.]|nr:conserved hypothetical protein [methanotrophic bacterial endosymbiont of Bathymodiolus sp.]
MARVVMCMETPPRAWGRRRSMESQKVTVRNTPTGVGKTGTIYFYRHLQRKHPHGRGEDLHGVQFAKDGEETPPRAWGRRYNHKPRTIQVGNTPTGVGKTQGLSTDGRRLRKHPHGRGEDFAKPSTRPPQ